jgi:hypothetical protein
LLCTVETLHLGRVATIKDGVSIGCKVSGSARNRLLTLFNNLLDFFDDDGASGDSGA